MFKPPLSEIPPRSSEPLYRRIESPGFGEKDILPRVRKFTRSLHPYQGAVSRHVIDDGANRCRAGRNKWVIRNQDVDLPNVGQSRGKAAELHWSQGTLAKHLGYAAPTVSLYMTQQRTPSPDFVTKVTEFLETPTEQFHK